MSNLLNVLMERDGLDKEEALEQIREAKEMVFNGQDPEEVLAEMFGLEPDYFFDIV